MQTDSESAQANCSSHLPEKDTQSMKEVKKLGCEVGQGQGRVTAVPVLCPSPSWRRFSRIHSARACVVAIPRMSSMDHNAISLVLFILQWSLVVLASSVERRHSFHYHLSHTYYYFSNVWTVICVHAGSQRVHAGCALY